ncbi:hypothetical protein BDW59DRAFT_154328 [Aspergillus cavernicola]|uniref:SP-RING-type domain-containing protein n=1 Tax=Aspergillus cavernicola TaxID=176166 RepID=A0ABR4HGK9_9EURO
MTSHFPNTTNRPPEPPRNNPSSGGVLDLNRSNSTANLFLGGSRNLKSWMSSSSTDRNHNNNKPTNKNPIAPASESLSSSAPPPPPPDPDPVSPPVAVVISPASAPAPTRSQGMRNLSSHSQNNNIPSTGIYSSPYASPTVPVTSSPFANPQNVLPPCPQMPPSSDTPPSLTHSPASRPLPTPARPEQPAGPPADSSRKQRQKQQSQLQAHLQQQSASSLPSPDPTIPPRSHTSPSRAIERNASAIASPSTAVFPSPPSQQAPSIPRPRQNPPTFGTPSLLLGSNPPPAHPRTAPYTPPVHAHPTPAAPSRLPPPSRPNPAAPTFHPNLCALAVDDAYFANAKKRLERFVHDPGSSLLISETVEAPRFQLLLYACTEHDFMYLVLHQVYCLSSFTPSEFNQLPGITPKHIQGLDVVRHLLVDNVRVSGAFLARCANFPDPISELLKKPAYQHALNQVWHTLTVFVDHWHAFEDQVRSRGYPPLVDDIVSSLNITSPVLQFNIFLCLCRRIPGAKFEGKLQEIFIRDLETFKRRYVRPISEEQRQNENRLLITAYRSALATMKEHVPSAPLQVNGSAVARHSQVVSASAPAPAALPTTQNPPPPSHVQFHSRTHSSNGITPALVRSPPVGAPPRLPRQLGSNQSPTQQRSAGPLMVPSQMTGIRGPPPNPQFRPPPPPQQPQHSMLLLPPPNVPPVVNTRPNPNRLAIHQAYLRDPVNRLVSSDAVGETETELLPYLTSFVLDPQPLGQVASSFNWQFFVSDKELNCRPRVESQGRGQRSLRTLIDGNQNYRLRCIKVPPSVAEVSEHSWCVAETAWPCAVYLSVNGVEVYPRRKIHNGRDLPLDITQLLQEGENKLSVHFVRSAAEQRDLTYAMAVEVLTFRSFSHAKNLTQTLLADESRRRICGRLASNPDNENDELRIVSDDLKVTLVDPFTARLFVIPVRGGHCEHPECFDRDTFLQTRALKSGDHSAIEADWRCPICRRDARPQSLVVDGFLTEVRAELERMNRCDGARALQVKADGSWEVKTEEDLASAEHGTPQPSRTVSKRKSTALENGIYLPSQRPKIDRSASMPGGDLNQSPTFIILD